MFFGPTAVSSGVVKQLGPCQQPYATVLETLALSLILHCLFTLSLISFYIVKEISAVVKSSFFQLGLLESRRCLKTHFYSVCFNSV